VQHRQHGDAEALVERSPLKRVCAMAPSMSVCARARSPRPIRQTVSSSAAAERPRQVTPDPVGAAAAARARSK
jgi:hypothetical protein